jgi:hypothetical protein
VCSINYKEYKIRSWKWKVTPKNKEMTSNKIETSEWHFCGQEKKIIIAAIIEWIQLELCYHYLSVF